MNNININRSRFSEIAWEIIFENSLIHAQCLRNELFSQSLTLDELRTQADYDTGSISSSAIWTLFSACSFFKPKIIAEVGTFIGKSTFAMACALDTAHTNESNIFTCDFSNSITLEFTTRTKIRQFKKKSSTDMFSTMLNEGVICDLLVLDGRLQNQDYSLLLEILHSDAIILLDDFEGTEKGVVNAQQLMRTLQGSHLLVYPPTRELLRHHGLQEACTMGMIIPRHLVTFTNQ